MVPEQNRLSRETTWKEPRGSYTAPLRGGQLEDRWRMPEEFAGVQRKEFICSIGCRNLRRAEQSRPKSGKTTERSSPVVLLWWEQCHTARSRRCRWRYLSALMELV